MDPKACLARLLDAIKERDWEEAADAARDLSEWLTRGGFPPDFGGGALVALVCASAEREVAEEHEHARILRRCWTLLAGARGRAA